jgi:predicted AAA+ superfamily ATPase
MFSHSVKAQIINPRKVYAIDTGLVNAVSNTMTDDVGRKLENLVFIHLRKEFKEMFYFDDKGECDFVVMKKGKVIKLVQVCYELTPDNLKRELNGLLQAMRFFNIKAATIVTFNNSDLIKTEGFEIEVIPAYQYLSKKL